MQRRYSINKLEANVSLVIITFFASIQYMFLRGVPNNISSFAFLFITSFIGFIILFLVFFSELFRIDYNHIIQCFVLSIESFLYNLFLLLGSKDIDSTTVASVISSYFVFIPILEFTLYKILPKRNTIVSIIFVLIGIPLIIGLNIEGFYNQKIVYLVLADIMIALNIVTISKFVSGSNPAILSMGQLFFTSIIALFSWFIESRINNTIMSLPNEPMFWGSVIFISFFIRGLYTVVQIYAQRYVSPVNVALIFSSEIVMTLLLSGSVYKYIFDEPYYEEITIRKFIGVILMLVGIVMSEIDIPSLFIKNYNERDKIH